MSEFKYTNNGRYFIKSIVSHSRNKKLDLNIDNLEIRNSREISNLNLNKGYKTLGISSVTQKKIKLRCRVLMFCAKKKRIRDLKGNIIRHRISFITLTLPSKQVHDDKIITKVVLGTFLDRCRKIGLLENYIWKAEKQKNGNIHYHIITDSYCNRTIIYRYWLLSLNKLGYVERYTDKFRNMDLKSYSQEKFNRDKNDYQINKAYWKGSKNKWKLPPCYDSRNISENSTIENYISKYISKSDCDKDLQVKGRVWGCSNSVNLATEIFKNDEDFNKYGFELCKYVLKKEIITFDYCSIIIYDISKFFIWYPNIHKEILKRLYKVFKPCCFYD